MAEAPFVIALAWRSRLGKAVGGFLVQIINTPSEENAVGVIVEIVEFKSCWYKTQEEFGQTEFNSLLFTTIEQLPELLREKVKAFIGTRFLCASIDEALSPNRYIDNPLV